MNKFIIKMKSQKFLFVFDALFLIQWFGVSAQSSADRTAKVIGAMQKQEDAYYMEVVKDSDADSGWAVDVKNEIPKDFAEINFYAFFYSRKNKDEKFEQIYRDRLCDILTRSSSDNLLPRELIQMIFPKQMNSCKFDAAKNAILAESSIHTAEDDNLDFYLPESTPYQLEVRIMEYQQIDAGDYIFKVTFDVE